LSTNRPVYKLSTVQVYQLLTDRELASQ